MKNNVEKYLETWGANSKHTLRAKRNDLNMFVEFLSGKGISEFGQLHRGLLLEYLHERGKVDAPATVERRLATLSHFLKASGSGVDIGGIRLPRRREPRVSAWTTEQQAAIRAEARKHSRRMFALVELGLMSGLRRSELLGLRVGQYDCGEMVLRDVKRKGGWLDDAVLVARTAAAIELYLTEREQTLARHDADYFERPNRAEYPLFISTTNAEPGNARSYRWNETTAVREFIKVGKRAGIDRPHMHAMRHTCGTELARRGVPLADIARHLGHVEPSTTFKFYLRPDVETRRAVGKMLLDLEDEK